MAKKESNFTNMVIALFTITFIASAALGLVNELTNKAIIDANAKAQSKAIASVLPAFESLDDSYKVLPKGEQDSLEFFPALDAEGKTVGTAVKTYTKNGFSGLITVMVGFDPEGKISGFQVLAHQETPGLGSKMGAWFSDITKEKQNIVGMNPAKSNLTVSKDGGDVDAITAATISSRAFLESIRRAYSTWKGQVDATTSATSQNKDYSEGGNS